MEHYNESIMDKINRTLAKGFGVVGDAVDSFGTYCNEHPTFKEGVATILTFGAASGITIGTINSMKKKEACKHYDKEINEYVITKKPLKNKDLVEMSVRMKRYGETKTEALDYMGKLK